MKYLIHACPKRMWYVQDYLVPSMKEQGINQDNIEIFEDKDKLGNLVACLTSFNALPETGNTWHLQDDVVISKWFRERTEQYNEGIVNGFCSKYCKTKPAGKVTPPNMWYSFPCTHIPNELAHEFIHWFYTKAVNVPRYRNWIDQNKFDDEFFMRFIQEVYPNMEMLNLSPNLVDHVDYLVGGSIVNTIRTEDRRALFWNEEDVIRKLKYQLTNKR